MGLGLSHGQLDEFEPDAIVRVNRNLLYDQRNAPNASIRNVTSSYGPARIIQYRTDTDRGQEPGRQRSTNIASHTSDHQSSSNDCQLCCENLLVGDCHDSKAPSIDTPSQTQGKRVHRILDMVSLAPVETHAQLERIMSQFPGWARKDCDLETGWVEYRFTSSSGNCLERVWLPSPDLQEASSEVLDTFARTVNKLERRLVFEVWTWTIYQNPLYSSGRLSLVPSPRKSKSFPMIPGMCKQEMFAMEMRAHLHHTSMHSSLPRKM
ncbi:hypothetical protein MPTK1_6g19330 [Marchantia polymorpha subsp. ruderalis]|uniref:Uncharacterized protein n=2 Tax=Marchantia polymorpha TaxID=3197 RepID=A0AAF6BTR8_MARPO|nr:hypothetical protein MARPO_0045s0130 [Marchantia polymorpha]BBN15402.1 hypothetical protein Mp_6g19330 [Marchantia polymorpha subsp. ruderalis]|eukprot:PTQ39486.1 hypothetical protein MARPO_0045s0130 [Marchantia polymorpha]